MTDFRHRSKLESHKRDLNPSSIYTTITTKITRIVSPRAITSDRSFSTCKSSTHNRHSNAFKKKSTFMHDQTQSTTFTIKVVKRTTSTVTAQIRCRYTNKRKEKERERERKREMRPSSYTVTRTSNNR